MQKLKPMYRNREIRGVTFADSQKCLRFNDLDEIGDGTHYLDFDMLGLFSIRHWSLKMGVDFWLEFLKKIEVYPDVATIHPDCPHHASLYTGTGVVVKEDSSNTWSDGDIGGYCTELYKDGVEIGNIVISLGENLDCGFGLSRLQNFVNGSDTATPSRGSILSDTISLLVSQGVVPSNSKQGYVLRKLIRTSIREGIPLPDLKVVVTEKRKVEAAILSAKRLLKKSPEVTDDYLWGTLGVKREDLL